MPARTDAPAAWPELERARRGWRFRPGADALSGKTVLITGAGDGIGKTLAKTVARHGANPVLLGRTREKLEAVFDWVEARTRARPVIVPCDLAQLDEAGAASLKTAIRDSYGRLDGLVHNAALLGVKAPIEHYPLADWDAVMAVNLKAAALLTQALLPLMQAGAEEGNSQASIVFTSSGVGRRGRAYWGAYAVSKFANEGLMQVLADELAGAGRVRVNSLNPGATRSAMRQAAFPAENPDSLPSPEARMDLYLYLLSDASQGVTGQAFDADSWAGPPAS